MWLMLQQNEPDDYVIATGETHSVKEFVNLAFAHAGIEIEWKVKGASEKGIIRSLTSALKVGDCLIEIDPRYFRPLEVEFLQGDASKAKKKLKWEPKVRFKEMVKIMVDSDIKDLEEMKQCQDVIRKLSNNKSKQ
jgi:GDPmannose 4,6-dehydratase